MAIDTFHKRLSAMGLGCPVVSRVPLPDGTIDADARMMLLGLYGDAPPESSYHVPTVSAISPISIVQYFSMTPVNLAAYFDIFPEAGPGTFTIASGELPVGVVLSSNGSLSGTPLSRAVFTVTVRATDTFAGVGTSDPFTITVTPNPANAASDRSAYGRALRFRIWR